MLGMIVTRLHCISKALQVQPLLLCHNRTQTCIYECFQRGTRFVLLVPKDSILRLDKQNENNNNQKAINDVSS